MSDEKNLESPEVIDISTGKAKTNAKGKPITKAEQAALTKKVGGRQTKDGRNIIDSRDTVTIEYTSNSARKGMFTKGDTKQVHRTLAERFVQRGFAKIVKDNK